MECQMLHMYRYDVIEGRKSRAQRKRKGVVNQRAVQAVETTRVRCRTTAGIWGDSSPLFSLLCAQPEGPGNVCENENGKKGTTTRMKSTDAIFSEISVAESS